MKYIWRFLARAAVVQSPHPQRVKKNPLVPPLESARVTPCFYWMMEMVRVWSYDSAKPVVGSELCACLCACACGREKVKTL